MLETHKIFTHINVNNFRSILALNGELPDKNFFTSTDLPIIAADGAVNTLSEIGVRPNVVIGDLDSIRIELLEDIEVVRIFDQAQCDFEKALAYLSKHQLLPTIVVGLSGGYIDHIINNISIFLRHKDMVFYSPPIFGCLINSGKKKIFSLPINSKISIFGISNAIVSSYGLKWELKQELLDFPYKNSAFNRTNIEKFEIQSHQGIVLVIIYLDNIKDCGA